MVLSKLINFDSDFAKSFRTKTHKKNFIFIGVDEVGRGALAGPVIACAFAWKRDLNFFKKGAFDLDLKKLNDSKKLSKKIRLKISCLLKEHGYFGIGYASVLEVEKLNVLNATFISMKRAFENLISGFKIKNTEPYLLIDGNKFNPYINCRQVPIIGGDAKSSLIASASVIAKTYRDDLMSRLSTAKRYKVYGWSRNVGYGTAFHIKAVRKYGDTPLHRKSFLKKI